MVCAGSLARGKLYEIRCPIGTELDDDSGLMYELSRWDLWQEEQI